MLLVKRAMESVTMAVQPTMAPATMRITSAMARALGMPLATMNRTAGQTNMARNPAKITGRTNGPDTLSPATTMTKQAAEASTIKDVGMVASPSMRSEIRTGGPSPSSTLRCPGADVPSITARAPPS